MNKRRRYKAKRRRRAWRWCVGRVSKRQAFGLMHRNFNAAQKPRLAFNPHAFEIATEGLFVTGRVTVKDDGPQTPEAL